ncbi:MAG: type V CRISPR-associated protein Cas4, partial [Acidaminococcaceae bacterium]|nr:type V CRISPR-associated protein Cas4 [Acidaminococcaceae bacterium]
MDDLIPISYLNDFIFCPVSIYFHQVYGEQERMTYQCSDQINGTAAHKSVDSSTYTTRKNVLQGLSVYSERLRLIGKIDVFYQDIGVLTERKKRIKTIYDGYVFQIYAQCYCLREMG